MLIFLAFFLKMLQNWLRDQGENQKKLFLGISNVWEGGGEERVGRKEGDGDLGTWGGEGQYLWSDN